MQTAKADMITKLKKDILLLQSFKQQTANQKIKLGIEPIERSFPHLTFPGGVIHEFLPNSKEDVASTNGFVAGILASFMCNEGAAIWISSSRTLFPPALKSFGIDSEKIIFLDLKKDKDVMWAMEEALKCEGLTAVIGEIKNLDFVTSKRFQVAVEKSHVTGFILLHDPRNINITASVSRWKISSLISFPGDEIPGVGFPRWNVELLKVRNGKPGAWQVELIDKKFRLLPTAAEVVFELQKKTG
jgi:protein ImuA